jgi:hypothetical protein
VTDLFRRLQQKPSRATAFDGAIIRNLAAHKSKFAALKDEQRFFGADLEAMLVSRRRNVEAMMQMNRLTSTGSSRLGGVNWIFSSKQSRGSPLS